MRGTWCGKAGLFFSELPAEQRLSRQRVRVTQVGAERGLGDTRLVGVEIDGVKDRVTVALTQRQIEALRVKPGRILHVRVASAPGGWLLEDWETSASAQGQMSLGGPPLAGWSMGKATSLGSAAMGAGETRHHTAA